DVSLTVGGGAGAVGGVPLQPIDLDLSMGGELAPTLVALAAFASGPSRITGIGHLRGHETDRLAALVSNIKALGGDASELDDGIEVRPRPLHGGEWGSFDDHRMATAGAIIGLGIDGVEVENVQTTAKTLPEFVTLWESLTRPTPAASDPLTIGLS
ncbi:MAG TPA: 3-phosphoshikimate 1-carboxyvinyltransferase, partial [Terrimesophilobacter sp.]|nr:3-phosphoshikimate 1-carboxyvinyltransferase [Terrimesophilobacter sp.]